MFYNEVRKGFISLTANSYFKTASKLDGSAKEALMQIEEKQYAMPYLNDERTVHMIGVNISCESRTIDEWTVK